MKEAYQQAVMESESGTNIKRPSSPVEVCDTRSLLEKFEKGEVYSEESKVVKEKESDDMSVFESGKVFVNSQSHYLYVIYYLLLIPFSAYCIK